MDCVGLDMCREWKEIEFPKGYYIYIYHQIDLKESKNANKIYYKIFLEIKTYLKIKIKAEEHNNRQNFNIFVRNLHTNKER